MLPELLDPLLHWFGGNPCFRVYGKGRRESEWRVVSVYASHRRDVFSGMPLWSGACTTWAADIIAVGWDFALGLLREQRTEPVSRDHPAAVIGGRLRDNSRRAAAGATRGATYCEIMAHECGHTWQARRMGPIYLPMGAALTLFREGPHPWNRFENEASEEGLFGGVVPASVNGELMRQVFV